MLNIKIILGSTRQGRQGEKVARWILAEVSTRPGLEVELLDLKDWDLLMYQAPASPQADRWMKKIAEADGYIIVTPEYNHGYPAVLKNALDYPYKEWNNKPVGFISYSNGLGGGVRSVEQLKLVCIELQMAPIRATVAFPQVQDKFDEKNLVVDPESYSKTAGTFLDQLVWWGQALKTARG